MAKTKAESNGSMLKITLTAGKVGRMEKQLKVLKALGLGKHGSSVVHAASPTINGMVRKVSHMVTVEPTNEKSTSKVLAKQAK